MSGAKQPAGDRANIARAISSKGKGNRRTVPSAKSKAKAELESRTVFKAVFDNPFEVKWSIVPPNVQNTLLARVSELLAGVADYNTELSRNRSRRHKRKRQHQTSNEPVSELSKEDGELGPIDLKPAILEHVAIGINEVTKRLETQCSIRRTPLLSDSPKSDSNLAPELSIPSSVSKNTCSNPLRAIFVCRADLSTPQLVEHFPALIAAVNSRLISTQLRAPPPNTSPTPQSDKPNNTNIKEEVIGLGASRATSTSRDEAIMSIDTLTDADGAPKPAYDPEEREPGMIVDGMPPRPTLLSTTRVTLVPLPRGAEEVLKQATGLRHVSVLAFDAEIDSDPQIAALLSDIPTLTAPWLTLTPTSTSYLPTSIRLKQTTAPKDMRASKAARAAGRGVAKARHRAALAAKKAKLKSEVKAKTVVKKTETLGKRK